MFSASITLHIAEIFRIL